MGHSTAFVLPAGLPELDFFFAQEPFSFMRTRNPSCFPFLGGRAHPLGTRVGAKTCSPTSLSWDFRNNWGKPPLQEGMLGANGGLCPTAPGGGGGRFGGRGKEDR